MEKRILVVGATGTMATAVVREMAARKFETTAFVRNIEKAKELLPPETKLIKGDLSDKEQLRAAVANITHLYFHPPPTIDPEAPFIVERDGLQNILDVLPRQTVLLKLSEIDAAETPNFSDLGFKYRSEQTIKNSGQPFIIFRPTWFMEAFPLQLTQNNAINIFGEQPNPIWFVATKDYAQAVCSAVEKTEQTLNQTFTVQGLEGLTMADAAQIIVQLAKPDYKLTRVPLEWLQQSAQTEGHWQFVYELMSHYNNRQETFQSTGAWEILGHPQITFAEFARSLA